MDLADYNLMTLRDLRLLRGCDLWDRRPRTLLIGDTRDGHIHHVYLGTDGVIHLLKYVVLSTGRLAAVSYSPESARTDNSEYVPDHRLDPGGCDFEVCLRLKAEELMLPFSEWRGQPAGRGTFYGKTVDQLSDVSALAALGTYPPQWPDAEYPAITDRLEASFKREGLPFYRNLIGGQYLVPVEFVAKAREMVLQETTPAKLAA